MPLITALGIGLAAAVSGRDVLMDGFGLIAFASVGPVIAVLGYACAVKFGALARGKSSPPNPRLEA